MKTENYVMVPFHRISLRIMKTENYVMVPFHRISLRTKFKENKNHEYQSL